MTYEQMKEILENYNWDDGLEIPKSIILDVNCDLAMALEIFYLGDGFGYFQRTEHDSNGSEKWLEFIGGLYEDIKEGKFQKMERNYIIPLTKVQKYQLRKNNIPEVFLIDM